MYPIYAFVCKLRILLHVIKIFGTPCGRSVEAPYFLSHSKDLEVASNDFYTMLLTTEVYADDASSDNIMPLNPANRVKGNRIIPVASGFRRMGLGATCGK